MTKKATKKAAPKKAAKKSAAKRSKKGGEKINPELLPAVREPVTKQFCNIKYAFTNAEMIEKVNMIAKAINDRAQEEEDLKAIKSEFKMKIDAKSSEIKLLSIQIAQGHEYRNVECEVIKNFDDLTKAYYYEGKKVHEEPLTSCDLQLQLELEESKNN